jgi:hypothetical protein
MKDRRKVCHPERSEGSLSALCLFYNVVHYSYFDRLDSPFLWNDKIIEIDSLISLALDLLKELKN